MVVKGVGPYVNISACCDSGVALCTNTWLSREV